MNMLAAADRPEFAPPPQRGTARAVALALIAHAVLIAALTWGVRWKRDAENDAVEAELWSSTVQQAAPRAAAPPPAPAPSPAPPPPPPPPPAPPPPRAVAPPPPPVPKQPDINLEREKKLREQKEQREREEEQRAEKRKQEAAQKAALEKKKELEAKKREQQEEAERKKEQQQKLADQKRKQQEAEAKKAEAAKADAAAKQAAAAKADAAAKQAAAAQSAKDRDAAMRRMMAQAGSGGEGNAARSSGPSGSYGAKVAAAVRPNVVFPDADLVSGNPAVEFDVQLAPDGSIVGTPKLVKGSGLSGWDEAALRALIRTDKLPRDVDGSVPSRLIVSLRPKR